MESGNGQFLRMWSAQQYPGSSFWGTGARRPDGPERLARRPAGAGTAAPRPRKSNRRPPITDPAVVRGLARAQGLSPAEVEQAAQQALVNAQHARQALREEERMVTARRRDEKTFWGFPLWKPPTPPPP
jgi:hypothetical protein